MIDWGVPDVPESLQLKIKRENYLAKQALTDNIEAEINQVSLHTWRHGRRFFVDSANSEGRNFFSKVCLNFT